MKLIAEIGNNHFGSMAQAKELIRQAKDSGATHVKGQAFRAADLRGGSMPYEFYKQCEFELKEHEELVDYAASIGIDMFYSVFSTEFYKLWARKQKGGFDKYSASQFVDYQEKYGGNLASLMDYDNAIVSIPENYADAPYFRRAEILSAGPYMEDPDLSRLLRLGNHTDRRVGLSCHALTVEPAIRAVEECAVLTVEKHFTLVNDLKFSGVVFRDTVHGATPKEFERIAKAMNLGGQKL